MNTAASTGSPTPWPVRRVSPSTMDSGTPSRRAPIAIAAPLPDCWPSEGCWSLGPLPVPRPAPGEGDVGGDVDRGTAEEARPAWAPGPPSDSASATRSKASAEISTPAPKAITVATTERGTGRSQAISAPTTRAPPASSPHRPAWSQVAIDTSRHLLRPGPRGAGDRSGPERVRKWLHLSMYASQHTFGRAGRPPGTRRESPWSIGSLTSGASAPRTPRGTVWPARVDQYLEDGVAEARRGPLGAVRVPAVQQRLRR